MGKRNTRESILARTVILPSGCVEWTGTTTPKGYGSVGWGGAMIRAHRLFYELFVGPIPAGMQLDHLCFNPRCVAPAHLEPVTPRENVRRSYAAGRHTADFPPPAGLRNRAKTHCPQGHPYDEANTYLMPSTGWRMCRECTRLGQRRRYHEAAG